MSAPRIIAKVVLTGTRIFGRALAEAGRQAVRNAKHQPEAAASASSNFADKDGNNKSPAAAITNQHRMTLEEACLILNVKKDEPLDVIEKNYNSIFAANAPAAPPAAGGKKAPLGGSHYLQSKVFRALERIKAEKAIEEASGQGEGERAADPVAATAGATDAPLATSAPPPPAEGQPRPPPPENEPIATGPPPPSSGTKSA